MNRSSTHRRWAGSKALEACKCEILSLRRVYSYHCQGIRLFLSQQKVLGMMLIDVTSCMCCRLRYKRIKLLQQELMFVLNDCADGFQICICAPRAQMGRSDTLVTRPAYEIPLGLRSLQALPYMLTSTLELNMTGRSTWSSLGNACLLSGGRPEDNNMVVT